jgi:hypothetical protein
LVFRSIDLIETSPGPLPAMSAFGGKADIGRFSSGSESLRLASVPRLDGAFGNVDVAIDYLEVWQAPVGEQLRPWDVPVFLPYSKQRDMVIHFSKAWPRLNLRLEKPLEPTLGRQVAQKG